MQSPFVNDAQVCSCLSEPTCACACASLAPLSLSSAAPLAPALLANGDRPHAQPAPRNTHSTLAVAPARSSYSHQFKDLVDDDQDGEEEIEVVFGPDDFDGDMSDYDEGDEEDEAEASEEQMEVE